jgi:hypothetical protein
MEEALKCLAALALFLLPGLLCWLLWRWGVRRVERDNDGKLF